MYSSTSQFTVCSSPVAGLNIVGVFCTDRLLGYFPAGIFKVRPLSNLIRTGQLNTSFSKDFEKFLLSVLSSGLY